MPAAAAGISVGRLQSSTQLAALHALSIRMPTAEDSYIILNTTKRRGTAVHAIHVLPGKDERWSAAAIALVPGLETALAGQAKVPIQCLVCHGSTWSVLADPHSCQRQSIHIKSPAAGVRIVGVLPEGLGPVMNPSTDKPSCGTHPNCRARRSKVQAAFFGHGLVRIIATALQVIRETQGAETPQLLAVFGGNISYKPGGQATGLRHGEPKPPGQACSYLCGRGTANSNCV